MRSDWGAAATAPLCDPEQQELVEHAANQKLAEERAICVDANRTKVAEIRRWLKANPEPKCLPRLSKPPTSIVVHHTADVGNMSGNGVREIQAFHMQKREWADIGYHFIIAPDKNGRWQVHEGRARLPGQCNFVQGAHVGRGMNDDSIGISIVGNYSKARPSFRDPRSTTAKTPPPEAQKKLLQLVAKLKAECPSIHEVMGHGEFKQRKVGCISGVGKACGKCATECPGVGCRHLPANLENRVVYGSK